MEKTEYEIFLIILKDQQGKARGIEKTWNDTIFYSEEDANRVLSQLYPEQYLKSFKVIRAIVTYDEE